MYAVSTYGGGKESSGPSGRPPSRRRSTASSGTRLATSDRHRRDQNAIGCSRSEKRGGTTGAPETKRSSFDLEIFPESAATSKTPKKRWAAPARAADQDQ